MTLKQIEAFYWAATLGTFAIAAERLHVTQSSLSKRIAELEIDLNQVLFDRSTRRARLTAAGEALLVKASAMLDLENQIRADSGSDPTEPRGVCRIGVTELTAMTWFPQLAASVAGDFPSVSLEPQVGLSRPLVLGVQRGELDLAVVTGPHDGRGLQYKKIAELEFVWTSSPVRIASPSTLTSGDFELHPVIGNPQDSGLSASFEAWMRTHGMPVDRTIQCNSRSAIIALTVAGVGISVQPKRYVQPLIDRGLLTAHRCHPKLPNQAYGLVWRQDDDRRLTSTVLNLVQDNANFDLSNVFWDMAQHRTAT